MPIAPPQLSPEDEAAKLNEIFNQCVGNIDKALRFYDPYTNHKIIVSFNALPQGFRYVLNRIFETYQGLGWLVNYEVVGEEETGLEFSVLKYRPPYHIVPQYR